VAKIAPHNDIVRRKYYPRNVLWLYTEEIKIGFKWNQLYLNTQSRS